MRPGARAEKETRGNSRRGKNLFELAVGRVDSLHDQAISKLADLDDVLAGLDLSQNLVQRI